VNDREVEIVIVEDNPNDAELVTRVLKKHGMADKSILLKDGVEALEFLFAQGSYGGRSVAGVPKVVLLDLKLPKVDGIEVLRRLKADERTRAIPVVALTSSTEQRDLKAAYDLGVNSYVTKPIEFAKFAGIVAELGKYWLEVNTLPSR
jgi:CheY-like chemotaxis protein